MALKKDPDEVLDYLVDWAGTEQKPGRLVAGDSIVTSTWIMPTTPDSALIKDSDTHDDTTTTIWLSGGTLGAKYTLQNRVVTDDGRTMDKSMVITIVTR